MVTFTVTYSSDEHKATPCSQEMDLQGAAPPGLHLSTQGPIASPDAELGEAAPPGLAVEPTGAPAILPANEAPPAIPGLAAGAEPSTTQQDDDLGIAGPPPL